MYLHMGVQPIICTDICLSTRSQGPPSMGLSQLQLSVRVRLGAQPFLLHSQGPTQGSVMITYPSVEI